MASRLTSAIGLPATTNEGEGVDDLPTQDYKYQVEISQMMFVFGDITDPHPDVTKLIEDIVRNQTIEMIIQSRRLAQRRGSKYLASEDLIFLIRYDRAKINRLRTYLSWKDVRKNAKDSGDGGAGGGAGGGADVDGLADDAAIENPAKATMKKIRLPWEISTAFSEYLRPLNAGDEEEEDEDDIEAYEDSMQRLRDADEATRRMTREEYVHYSECRQASFTFRRGALSLIPWCSFPFFIFFTIVRLLSLPSSLIPSLPLCGSTMLWWNAGKRFREFINAGAYLDVKPNDDIIDILGFLAFEVVRELVLAAISIKKGLEEQDRNRDRPSGDSNEASFTSSCSSSSSSSLSAAAAATANGGTGENGGKRKSPPPETEGEGEEGGEAKRQRTHSDAAKRDKREPEADPTELCGLFTLRPTVGRPLKPAHIHEAFARLQRGRAALAGGMRGAGGTGGLRRTRVFVI
ncbi:Transcription initiation protein spt3 [Thecaphora frezii]